MEVIKETSWQRDWPPRVELGGKVEGSISMRNERVEDIDNKLHDRGLFRIVVGKRQTKP